ncbi:protein BNIP5 isoform X2 [Nycticebus coucang]|uniref:protein BNIP5 isoform X2 n=1 Tax=Nycticebus coucang TaxID=9470 RepID=UPI00234C8983|nr:protein BNIP5 isoform X2 [Nycticebus coucang]
MENPRHPRKPVANRRTKSLDRLQAPRKDSESWDCQCLSVATASSRKTPRRRASDGARRSAEAQGPASAVLTPEETREFLSSEQSPPQDTKKDKAQQGWLKRMLTFFLRTGPEEPREKASRQTKGKEGPLHPPESPREPDLKKRAHDKKAGRKKHGHKKYMAEEPKGAPDEDAEGPEAGLSKTAAALHSEEVDLGPARRGREDSDLHQPLVVEEGGAIALNVSPQASDHQREEEIKMPDQDAIIKMIVELLKKVGDQWEEEQLRAPQPEVAMQNPVPASRKKSQEKKSSPKRAFSKKHSSEEPKRAGATDVSTPEARPPKRPSFLPLHLPQCVGGHRPSISSTLGLEEPEVQEVLSTDGGGPSPFEPSTQPGSQGPWEELQLDRAAESKFIQKIVALLHDAEEQRGEKQTHIQEVEAAVESVAPPCRRKSQEKKSSFKRGFSYKKHSSKEHQKAGAVGAAGAASPEARRPKRPSYLPTCVSGHRPSTSSSLDPECSEFQEPSPAEGGPVGISEAPSKTRSHKPEGGPQPDGASEAKEVIIQKLVVLLQEVDGQLGQQIRRHPSFKRFFYEFSDSSLSKLVATLCSQVAHSSELDRNLAKRPYQFGFGMTNKFASHKSHAISILMGLRSHYSSTQFLYRESQLNITSQSPD